VASFRAGGVISVSHLLILEVSVSQRAFEVYLLSQEVSPRSGRGEDLGSQSDITARRKF
jgi:hypothetical protein